MAPTNAAAWLDEPKARFTVREAPYTPPKAKEVVVKVAAVASNPLDANIQEDRIPTLSLKYPTIIGGDVAGEIVEVGEGVNDLEVGQRVIAHATGFFQGKPAGSGFQQYTTQPLLTVSRIPKNISAEKAAVIALALDTSVTALFGRDFLNLPLPWNQTVPHNSAILIWGGASSIGCSGIQLARLTGCEILTTASSRNTELCKSLGASQVFDYNDADVNDKIVAALKGKNVVGAYDCIANKKTYETCAQILHQLECKKLVVGSMTLPGNLVLPNDVKAVRLMIPKLFMETPEIAIDVHKHLYELLEQGKYVPKPDPMVVGHGLEHIQHAVDTLSKGVSAAKVVVTL